MLNYNIDQLKHELELMLRAKSLNPSGLSNNDFLAYQEYTLYSYSKLNNAIKLKQKQIKNIEDKIK